MKYLWERFRFYVAVEECLEMINPPPFIPIKSVRRGTPEYEAIELRAAFFIGAKQTTQWERSRAVDEYYAHLMSDMMASAASQFSEQAADPGIKGSTDSGPLTLPNVRAAIKQIITAVDEVYLNGVTTIYVVHHPSMQMNATQMMSTLTAAGTSGHIKLISVEHAGTTTVLPVETYPMQFHGAPFDSTGWMVIMFNPDRPVVQIFVPAEEQAANFVPLYGLEDTTTVEQSAIKVICTRLTENMVSVNGLTYEPNGATSFPDFEATIAGEEWSIEVTRVLEGITDERVIRIGNPMQTHMTISASQASPIRQTELDDAVAYSIMRKSAKSMECKPGNKFCLVLINVADLNIGRDQYDWGQHDLSSFDAVVLLQIRPGPIAEATNIRGSIIPG